MADDKKKIVEEKKDDKAKTEAKPKAKPKKTEKAAKGDIITLDLNTWVIHQDGTEELYDTTSEELSKSEEIHDDKAKYGPTTTIIGAGRVMAGLDKSLEGAEIGKKKTVEIPPSEGAGDWDA
ncbi:MAG: FKBP-type peptidyl-prolyl cis-trans isomerase, partial [Thermoplasmata archaeon]|nr:FKBP-type peptidyl-prolyl cis-trans isomerase [Thermoplasmata archaeon]